MAVTKQHPPIPALLAMVKLTVCDGTPYVPPLHSPSLQVRTVFCVAPHPLALIDIARVTRMLAPLPPVIAPLAAVIRRLGLVRLPWIAYYAPAVLIAVVPLTAVHTPVAPLL
ncbi:hypothetical protein Pelo_19664 [Pelomyxa schiedti]|nr:hypothetical protein Pelo_19664 [Pelomyxa schiedti]